MDNGNTDLFMYRDSDVGDWSLLRTSKGNGIGLIGQPDVVALSISRENSFVGIGTTEPDSKLTVAGDIHSREVRVTIEAGADFVFEDDYNLPSLESTEKFIKRNKHLPKIPSEKEMKNDGLFLAEMNIKLLQKIEELTLYVIEQEKDNNKQSQVIESLENKFELLQVEIEKLKETN